MLGDLTSLLATLKGLPSGYNKDLQDDKRALFDAVDTVSAGAAGRGRHAGRADVRSAERMRAAVSSTMMATDLADYLVGKGWHSARRTRRWVARARSGGGRASSSTHCPVRPFAAAHPRLATTCSRRCRRRVGGTSRGRWRHGTRGSQAQLEAARISLAPLPETRGNELTVMAG